MQSKLIVLLVSSALATTGWAGERHRAAKAERAAKEESIGLGSGAAIGAIAGGPIGLIIGAAFGGWFGDRFHHERSGRLAAERNAAEAQSHASALETRLAPSRPTIVIFTRRSSAMPSAS